MCCLANLSWPYWKQTNLWTWTKRQLMFWLMWIQIKKIILDIAFIFTKYIKLCQPAKKNIFMQIVPQNNWLITTFQNGGLLWDLLEYSLDMYQVLDMYAPMASLQHIVICPVAISIGKPLTDIHKWFLPSLYLPQM